MSAEIVVIPLSRAPIEECAGLFMGTLAFPGNQKKALQFRDAYFREAIRLLAIHDDAFADGPCPGPARLLRMRDSEAEEILKIGDKKLFWRKQAFFACQSLFWPKVDRLKGFGTVLSHTAEHRYVMTNTWLQKPASASTKPLIRDAITPSRPVIHAAVALWRTVSNLIELREAKDESAGLGLLFERKDPFAELVEIIGDYRTFALKIPELKLTDADLIRFVAD